MLRNTFLHLPGIGEKTERRLWAADVHTWNDALSASTAALPRCLATEEVRQALTQAQHQWEREQWDYFERCLPGAAKWRAFEALQHRALYVDIETDGYTNEITVLGIYDGNLFHAFVAGQNLEQGLALLESAALVITFNGSGFDMPIIRRHFPQHLFNHVHIDLMWPLRKLGFRGGLKRIEHQLGLCRSSDTANMSGLDAVYLWQQYQRGSREALATLLRYNEEDVRNLEPLMRYVYASCKEQVGITLRP